MNLGSFTIIKNERDWIGPHLSAWLPLLDQMVFFDGNSTDGTLETIEHYKLIHPFGYKIKLTRNADPKDLKEDYVKLFNECLRSLDTDIAMFLHPDMFPIKFNWKETDDKAWFVKMEHYAGTMEEMYEMGGRSGSWKNVMRLRNPDFGLHYYGHYGVFNEDMYFKEITGDNYEFYGEDYQMYPYDIKNSGIELAHFSDVRPYERRLERMRTCYRNQGRSAEAIKMAGEHPRVSLKDGMGLMFKKCDIPNCLWEAIEKDDKVKQGITI